MTPRIVGLVHPQFQRHFYDFWLDWLKTEFPELRAMFEVHEVPLRIADWSGVRLFLPWLQDPVQIWSPPTYHHANQIATECDSRGIPIINRVDRLINASKSRAAAIFNQVGIRTARMERIENIAQFRSNLLGLRVPLMVKEDQGHWGAMARAETAEGARQIPLERFRHPVAIEIVDVRNPEDRLYRKYRYLAAGNVGISQHLQHSEDWITRGSNRILKDWTQDEELDYISKLDPNHARFQQARVALGLDMIGIDYSYTPDGELIVWEVNPFTKFPFSTKTFTYRNPAHLRCHFAMLRLYLERAGLLIDERIEAGVRYEDHPRSTGASL